MGRRIETITKVRVSKCRVLGHQLDLGADGRVRCRGEFDNSKGTSSGDVIVVDSGPYNTDTLPSCISCGIVWCMNHLQLTNR